MDFSFFFLHVVKEQNPHILQGPTHSVEKSGRWRHASTTSEEEGVSPSDPNAGRLSSMDKANARAAAMTTDVATPDMHDLPTPEALPWLWPWPTD